MSTAPGGPVKLGVNRVHWPVTVLGPGRRVGIWVQGCSIHCAGCASRDTWSSPSEAALVEVDVLVQRIDRLVGERTTGDLDGVTISGGEPLDQPESVAALLVALRAWLHRRGVPSADLLLYTGYDEPTARARAPQIFELADALVVGPYRQDAPGTIWWGSANQRLVAQDPVLEARYVRTLKSSHPRLQVAVEAEGVFVIGVPAPGVLERLEAALAVDGITLQEVSWRR